MERREEERNWTAAVVMASDTLTAKLVTMCLLGGVSLFLGLIPIKISKGLPSFL